MSYVSELRKKVGNMPLELPGTGVIVWRENHTGEVEVLLQLRKDNSKFGLLGGGIELGETYKECALRELYEEAGLKIDAQDLTLVQVYAGPEHVSVHPNGDVIYHTVVVYSVNYDGEPNVDDRHVETGGLTWFSLHQLSCLLGDEPEEVFFHNNIPIIRDIVSEFF